LKGFGNEGSHLENLENARRLMDRNGTVGMVLMDWFGDRPEPAACHPYGGHLCQRLHQINI